MGHGAVALLCTDHSQFAKHTFERKIIYMPGIGIWTPTTTHQAVQCTSALGAVRAVLAVIRPSPTLPPKGITHQALFSYHLIPHPAHNPAIEAPLGFNQRPARRPPPPQKKAGDPGTVWGSVRQPLPPTKGV